MDLKSTFLNGVLEEEIYVQQSEGFIVEGNENKVYRLKKTLYGFKQALRVCYSRIDAYLLNEGFSRSDNDATLYVKKLKNEVMFLVSLYVDDLLVSGLNDEEL